MRKKSLFPAVPVLPVAALVVGLLLERVREWAGTVVIVLLHVVPLLVAATVDRREAHARARDSNRVS